MVDTGRVVDALPQSREDIPDRLLSSLSPLTWKHVNLTGDYVWEEAPQIDQAGFRPLALTI